MLKFRRQETTATFQTSVEAFKMGQKQFLSGQDKERLNE